MVKPSVRRPVIWMLLVGLLVLVFALSACGDSGAASTPAPTPTTSSTSASPTTAASANTVKITEKTGGQDVYTFAPATLTIKAGQSVTFDNQSDEYHQLILTDATFKPVTGASPFTADTIVPTSREGTATTLQVTFPTAGTYYYTSKLVKRLQDGQHPGTPLSKAEGTIIVQ